MLTKQRISRNDDEGKFANVFHDEIRLGIGIAAFKLVGWPTYHAVSSYMTYMKQVIERKPRARLSDLLAKWAHHPRATPPLEDRLLVSD